ncbi:MAG: 16S rRNA (cytosine(967)-C(5))-methyltransferase RsmB [Blastocatellia bacterium]|nr:16S rRNA (cytosine(967)-C(5))-methyltransferase RsmB [Blastocatellia bacterium]
MKVAPARTAAFEILTRVASENAYASHLLTSTRYDHLSSADHALAQELTLGVLRWQAQLDFFIEHFTKRKLAKLDLEVILALRIGLYQLQFLDRIPPHAAINESVNLVKLHKKHSAAPMVNAVLRAAQRTDKTAFAQLYGNLRDPLEKLSVETSHPKWLLQRWSNRTGQEETRQLAIANNHAPLTAFRFNPRVQAEALTREWLANHHIQFRNTTLTPNAMVVETGSLSGKTEPIQQGWIYLQDEASQLVAHLLANNPKSKIQNPKLLDLCAAPGSKTSLLASLLPKDALLVAGDLYAHRLQTMRELAARAKISNLNLLRLDATQSLPFATDAQFDLVLLDAPCSGLGTLQRHPEIKWRMTETRITELAELQKQLLANAATQVQSGGLLAYSVCSTEPEEGEEVIAAFCTTHPEFSDVTREQLTELEIDPTGLMTATFGARTFPHQQGCEGFFVCVLWKRQRG